MDIKVLKKDDSRSIFRISKINPSIANAIRRYILAYVPTVAIHDVEIKKNGSAIYDEMLAHRLGLIPLKTDLKSYKLWEGKKSELLLSAIEKSNNPLEFTKLLSMQMPKVKNRDEEQKDAN